jgi:hypothetical protein
MEATMIRKSIAFFVVLCCSCGGSTEDDASSTGGGGGAAGSAGAGGSGGSGECNGYTPQASAAELAKTPRINADSELLAIETAGTFVAEDALYDRILAELSQIFIVDPSVSAIRVLSPNTGSLIVIFDDTGWAQYQAGSYHGWDCANQAYGATDQGGLGSLKGTVLDFGGKRLNSALLVTEYGSFESVLGAESNALTGDGSDVCLEIQGDSHYFIFDAADGDCPAGCTVHYYSAFVADPGPVVTALGTYDPAQDPNPPTWYTDLADCRTRL